jgi:hypothetical protein
MVKPSDISILIIWKREHSQIQKCLKCTSDTYRAQHNCRVNQPLSQTSREPLILLCCVQVVTGRCQMTSWWAALWMQHCVCGMLEVRSVYVSSKIRWVQKCCHAYSNLPITTWWLYPSDMKCRAGGHLHTLATLTPLNRTLCRQREKSVSVRNQTGCPTQPLF